MPTTSTQTTQPSASATTPTAPGETPMGALPIAVIAIYLVLISVAVLYGLLKLWPHPTPSGEPRTDSQAVATASARAPLPDPETIYFIGGRFQASVYAETRLLLIVILSGALGSLMHSLRSLYWYTGNREMVWSWVAFYMLLPFTGSILAVIFYFVVRGGFFSPQASFENTSPFGFAALSALVGLFSQQGILKLKDVAETIFTKPGAGADAREQESVTPASAATLSDPIITDIDPKSGSTAGGQNITIQGTNFASNPIVLIGNLPANVVSSTGTTIQATTPASASATGGVVDIEVTNPDGKKAIYSQAYTYKPDTTTNTNANPAGDAG